MPLLSIVTPCLNAEAFIEESIRSVLDQRRGDIEHIVVDGGSTDDTLAVLSRFSHLRVIRQRDSGLYEALNRGINVAQGAFIGQLNADDCYVAGAFERVIDTLRSHPHVSMVTGTAIVGRSGVDQPGMGELIQSASLDVRGITFGVPAINARFMARSLYGRLGLYDNGYRRAADREFLLRAAITGVETIRLTEPLYWYRSHAGSLTIGGDRRRYLSVGREHMDIARHFLGDERVPAPDRAVLRRWHSEGATLTMADALLAGRLGQGMRALGEAISVDALAIPRLLKFGVEKSVRLLWADRHRGR